MTEKTSWADLAILPILCAMALGLFALSYTVGELTVLRQLRQDAEAAAFAWQRAIEQRIDPALADPLAPLIEGGTDQALAWTGTSTGADVRAVGLLDPAGRFLWQAGPGDVAPAMLSAREFYIYNRMLETKRPQYLVPDSGDQTVRRTVFYLPLSIDGAFLGGLRLDVDQTAVASLLRSSERARMTLNGLLALIVLSTTGIILWRRIRERRSAEAHVRFLAMHDPLTGLPNRAQFNTALTTALDRSRCHASLLAVICIDVDNFKQINDTLGHPVGDAVLKGIAERLVATSGRNATISRLSGDEFAVFLEDLGDSGAATRTAERYLRMTSIPLMICGHELICTISAGIAMAPYDGMTAGTLMKNADLALYRAKADGRSAMRFFTKDMARDMRRRREIETALRSALAREEMHLVYQPQIDLTTGELVGYEVLTRWIHPQLGTVPPSEFIPIAETSGLIVPLGAWVIRTAFKSAAAWEEPATVAVNLSATQFRNADLVDMIERTLIATGLPPHRLEVEITESVLIQNTESALAMLRRLRGLGVSIALDDFGTGYSSLSYLSRFPIDKIKIDRSFVLRIGEDDGTTAIVDAIVGLGRSLGATVVAEGVETYEQLAHLRAIGCHQVQGNLFGEPRESVAYRQPEVHRLQSALLTVAG